MENIFKSGCNFCLKQLLLGKQRRVMGREENNLARIHFLFSGEGIKHSSVCQTVVLDYKPKVLETSVD